MTSSCGTSGTTSTSERRYGAMVSCRPRRPSYGVSGRQHARGVVSQLVACVLVCFMAACSAGPQPVEPSLPPSAGGTSPSGSGAVPSADQPPRYDAVGVDLCQATDVTALAGLSLTVAGRQPRQPSSAPGAACLFDLRTEDGHDATLLVEAATLGSVERAKLLYAATRDVSVLSPDGAVPGLGDEAEAFARASGSGVTKSEYLLRARAGNLVTKVWLTVNGAAATPKASLAEPAKRITAATLAIVPHV